VLGCAGALRWTVDHDRLPYPTTAPFHPTSMIPRFGLVLGVLSLQAAAAAAPASRAEPRRTSRQSAPTVRVAVDVIPIDVQVLDRQGKPITGLEASKFTVSINGRRHRVLSADLIQTAANATTPPAVDAGTSGAAASRVSRRVMVLAIDCISFSPGRRSPAIHRTTSGGRPRWTVRLSHRPGYICSEISAPIPRSSPGSAIWRIDGAPAGR
jgi:hypothetical protein